jgi:hypothetical protein
VIGLATALFGCTPAGPRVAETVDEPVALPQSAPGLPARSLPTDASEPVAAPLSLTASDGTGLRLVSMTARGVVQEPLAFTELHLVFENPEDRTIEGRFTIDLPPEAAISRLAMKIGDQWQEGEVVERQAARRAFEDALHRKEDPALLEQETGNRFSARVFPIPARGRKEIILSYSQELGASAEPYRLLLRGLPELERLDARVTAMARPGEEAHTLAEVHETHYTPDGDLEVASPALARPVGLRSDDLAVARVIAGGEMPAVAMTELTVLLDTSASRALDFAGQVRRLGALLAELRQREGNFRLRVIAFDQDLSLVFDGHAEELDDAVLDTLYSRRALGASDPGRALARLSRAADISGRVLLVTDGIATAGARETAELSAAVVALRARGVTRLDAIIDGGLQDRDALVALTTAGLPDHGIVTDARLPAATLADKLLRATLSQITVSVPHSTWSWPRSIDGVQPGDEVLVYARLPATSAMTVVLTGEDAIETRVPTTEVDGPLVQRAIAGAKIEALTARYSAVDEADTEARAQWRKEIIELSTKHRVLSDLTALIVLETEADYARHGIDRNALADILEIREGQLAWVKRTEPVVVARQGIFAPRVPPMPGDFGALIPQESGHFIADPMGAAAVGNDDEDVWGGLTGTEIGEAYGVGGLGLIGSGVGGGGTSESTVHRGEEGQLGRPTRSGYARGSGPGFGGRGRRVPQVRISRPLEAAEVAQQDEAARQRDAANPHEGKMLEVMTALQRNDGATEALTLALAWHDESPGDVLALLALGEVLERGGQRHAAARAYGSIIDLFPSRADLRRDAATRLLRLGDAGRALAIDSLTEAVEQRPDHPSGHRMLAYALVRAGEHERAFETILAATHRHYPAGRFAGVDRVLRDDVGILAAAWIAADPPRALDITARAATVDAHVATEPSTRFIMTWETDANDVDFHVHDGRGGHAYYSEPRLQSGGELFDDVTTGYGPECFRIEGTPTAFPYRFEANYFSRGPMGYGMGNLEILQHDGRGGLVFDDRPFVIMKDHATVQLGQLEGPLLPSHRTSS